MRTTLLFAACAVACAVAPDTRAVDLTLADALARSSASVSAPDVSSALEALDAPFRREPSLRAEVGGTSARTLDVFTDRAVRSDSVLALVGADYVLFDGGAAALRARSSQLAAVAYRDHLRDAAERRRQEVIESFAELFLAQERTRILSSTADEARSGLRRAEQMRADREISNLTAAAWNDAAIAAELQNVDAELTRQAAETRLRNLLALSATEPLTVSIASGELEIAPVSAPLTDSAHPDADVRRRSNAVEEARAALRPQATLSGFAGIAVPSASSGDSGTFGIYGLRLGVTLPFRNGDALRRLAEARLQLAEVEADRARVSAAERDSRDAMKTRARIASARIPLLTHAVSLAERRQQSIARLADAGIVAASEIIKASDDIARRKADLVSARVEVWKITRLLEATSAPDETTR